MGAGKTQFVKGLARAMGIKEEVVSPTFEIEVEYSAKAGSSNKDIKLGHYDAWRLESSKELDDIGVGRKITDKSIIAIEWADRVADLIRKYNEEAIVIWVKIEYRKEEKHRLISWGVL